MDKYSLSGKGQKRQELVYRGDGKRLEALPRRERFKGGLTVGLRPLTKRTRILHKMKS